MTGTFRQRIPTLSDAELRVYVARPGDYRPEAVEAALAELRRRGQAPPADALRDLEAALAAQREDVPGPSPAKLRSLARWTLGLGLGAALLLYLTARPAGEAPPELDPMNSKRYLRDMEVIGGKANVVLAQLREGAAALWAGRARAATVAVASLLAAGLLRLLGRDPRP